MPCCSFGLEHFRAFCYGRQVTIRSDCKPLKSIFSKPIAMALPRLQRILLQISIFNINVIYTKGKEVQVADCLHHLIKSNKDPLKDGLDLVVHDTEFTVSSRKHLEIAYLTSQDTTLNKLQEFILEGLPDCRIECKAGTKEYCGFKDEISVIQGMVLKAQRVAIPDALRPQMLVRLHQGTTKMKHWASISLFWPGLAKQMEEISQRCKQCQEQRASQLQTYPHQHIK